MELPAKEIGKLRKAGHLDEALALARESLASNPKDNFIKNAYGWVLYDLIKREAQSLESRNTTPSRLAACFDEWLGEYQALGPVDRPGMLHSLLLRQVLKESRAWPGFLNFARWWDPACLRDEDKQPYISDKGKTLPSLELQFMYAIGRAAIAKAEVGDEELEWTEGVVDAGIKAHQNDKWLPFYKSKLLLKKGLKSEAREFLRQVVKRQIRAGWAWSLFGQSFETEDPKAAITCYYHAIQLAGQPQEVLNTRTRLAQLLAAESRFTEAAQQIRKALQTRQDMGYRISQDLADLTRAEWYRGLSDRMNLPPEPDVKERAQAILFGDDTEKVQFRLGVIDNQNFDKELAHIAFSPDEGAVLLYRRFKNIADAPLGTLIEVGFMANQRSPIRFRRTEAKAIQGFCEDFVGKLSKRPGQSFGFVAAETGERVFVPPSLLANNGPHEGRMMQCRALLSKDRKHGKLGWKALSIKKMGSGN